MIELEPASDRVPPGLEAMLIELGAGEAGFGGTAFGHGEQTLSEFLEERVRQRAHDQLPEGRVPQTTFWILLDGTVAGMLKMRHYLNDALRIKGGHIGYYVAPWRPGRRRPVPVLDRPTRAPSDLESCCPRG